MKRRDVIEPAPLRRSEFGSSASLDTLIEGVLTLGVLLSGATLVVGLVRDDTDLLRCGLLLLMWTPVARVLVVALALLRAREWTFAAISLWILGVLAYSLHVARFF